MPPHSPSGRGQAAAINRRAVPALLLKKNDASGSSSSWRRLHDVEQQDIKVYLVLEEEELEFIEEGEDSKQWAVLYNTQQKLEVGQVVKFPDKGWLFIIRRSASRPAIEPVYFKAWGVKQV